jgi:multiple sugar transport system ATP-binding protein
MAKVSKEERRARVRDAAALLELEDLLERKPSQLSGGQRQRVAMGRAIVRQPAAFLMDEPLSNLDALLRVQMRAEIASLQRRLGVTTVYVTHDQVEAMTMGSRVAVLRDGHLQQCASPSELYAKPANSFVAGFMGSPPMNLVTVALSGPTVVEIGGAAIELPGEAASAAAEAGLREITVGIRPEHLTAVAGGGLAARVMTVEHLGADSHATCAVDVAGRESMLVARSPAGRAPAIDERVSLQVTPGAMHWFSPDSGERIADGG